MTIIQHCKFAGAAIAVTALSQMASAQTELPVRIVVPCAVGTPTDLLARIIAQGISEHTRQQVQVENITVATPIEMESAEKLVADDRTFLFNLTNCGEESGTPETTASVND